MKTVTALIIPTPTTGPTLAFNPPTAPPVEPDTGVPGVALLLGAAPLLGGTLLLRGLGGAALVSGVGGAVVIALL